MSIDALCLRYIVVMLTVKSDY